MNYIPIVYKLGDINIESSNKDYYLKMIDIRYEYSIEAYNIGMILYVRSEKFSCETQYFDVHSTEFFKFLNDLSDMYINLKGSTSLKSFHFPSTIDIKVSKGMFIIEGKIIDENWGKHGRDMFCLSMPLNLFDIYWIKRISKIYQRGLKASINKTLKNTRLKKWCMRSNRFCDFFLCCGENSL